MKASDLFVRCLEAEGVKRIFGVPGEENADFVMSLHDSSIELVLTRHEQGAAFMADVQGRLTGEPGVCLGTLGPGATNLMTGVANANMDRSPLVVLTGQAGTYRMHKESHQAMDSVSMFKPVTKWAYAIANPGSIPEVVRKAFKVAAVEKPGACHLELPEDVAKQDTAAVPLKPERLRRPVPDDKIVDRAWAAIRAARRPIILAGNGAIRKRASDQLRRFAAATGIGVVSTFMAKGCLDKSDPRCLFTIGLQAKDLVACAVEAADLVVAIGYDMVEYHPRLWNPDGTKPVVHLDFLPAEVDQSYPVAVEVVGDIAHALWMLNERVGQGGAPHFDLHQQAAVRQGMLADFAVHADDATRGSVRPQKVLWDAAAVLGPDDILLSDVGAHKMWIARCFHCAEPNTCLIPNGFCSMGFALPGAIAAKLVAPTRRVMAICGDGGFLMNVQEMETAARLGTDVVVMVWVDGGYGLISWKQEGQFGRHTLLEFGNPDFVQLAEAFGWHGARVTDAADLKPALDRAFAAHRPALIAVAIDYSENQLLSQRLGQIACPI